MSRLTRALPRVGLACDIPAAVALPPKIVSVPGGHVCCTPITTDSKISFTCTKPWVGSLVSPEFLVARQRHRCLGATSVHFCMQLLLLLLWLPLPKALGRRDTVQPSQSWSGHGSDLNGLARMVTFLPPVCLREVSFNFISLVLSRASNGLRWRND